ncbi:inositol polyphosphate-5-phosphatase A-like [Saccoglossus kowalevskii]|uniref:inositol-polyphosphate 5-phosphatase n=1 Tax=Saccoglossus kowalevskii TaxID=10224 RepID=A0ABM0M8D3_SACKO|nr:PREDICTED: type I inositol 1,4,5-trisphosphate 5-phosphatase-like [Saccoglossus kowalevskii]
MATEKLANVMLITANVGSIFEEPDTLMPIWMKEFFETIKKMEPQFIALHCQEVGGKNYHDSMQHISTFTRLLLESEEMKSYNRARIYLDDDYKTEEKFTALGCLYFIHESLQNIFLYDFEALKFRFISGKDIYTGSKLFETKTHEKLKFPMEFFPETRWSRKGFLRTRWSINDSIFDLVDIHLFHDASNIIAAEKSPSTYSNHRRKALDHAIQRFSSDKYDKVPFIMFGDFNFRLDQYGVIKSLCAKATAEYLKENDEIKRVTYIENDNKNKVILTMEKKKFTPHNPKIYTENKGRWLRKFDREARYFYDRLYEYDVEFPPSYPYSEDLNKGHDYMGTRIPGWCDRILLSHSARDLVQKDIVHPPNYSVIGPDVCMGDHKPVFLFFKLIGGKDEPPRKRAKSE